VASSGAESADVRTGKTLAAGSCRRIRSHRLTGTELDEGRRGEGEEMLRAANLTAFRT
jgi:hypothetical protein